MAQSDSPKLSHSPQTPPSSDHGCPPQTSSFNVLGWILGAMSLLNLVQDIGVISVFGKLKAWMSAYSLFVNNAGSLLFGWINYYWFSVTVSEHHALVISWIFAAAVARAEYRVAYYQCRDVCPWIRLTAKATVLLLIWGVGPLLLVIILPDFLGVIICALIYLYFAMATMVRVADDIQRASGQSIRRELVGVVGVFLVLVALNYSVFRTDGG